MMMGLGLSLMTSQPCLPATFLGASCKQKTSKFYMALSFPSESKDVHMKSRNYNTKDTKRGGKTHSIPQEKVEIFEFLEGWAEENLLPMLKPVEDSWQPQDFLPQFSSEGFPEDLNELKKRAVEIPDEFYVCLVGNMIAEEALPTYSVFLNSLDGVGDESGGAGMKSWARWNRGWSAEENRHGDLLNKYLYLCGRVDMRQIEKTIHYLIASGMDFRTKTNPWLAFIYTSFQERLTFVAHTNIARQAMMYGDITLAKICGTIAADEKRHERAYTKIIEKLFEIDPNATMMSMAEMMRKRINMPVRVLFDGKDHDLAVHLNMVTQKTGSYTVKDYGDVVDFFIKRWRVEEITGLSDKGRQAQEYICGFSASIRKLEERVQQKSTSGETSKMLHFSWIFNKEVKV